MNKIFAAASASILALAGAVTGAQAQNAMGSSSGELSNPTNAVPNFSVQTIGPVLNEIGVAWQVQSLEGGQQYIDALYADALRFVIFFTACRGGAGNDCVGMNTVAFFETAANAQTVQAFNFRYQFANAGVDPDGTAYISRYDIADYGIARGNIASSVVNFANLAAAFSQELQQAHQTVSLEGFASDMSATHLNQQGFKGMTGQEIVPATPMQRHEVSFEESAEIVQRLIKDRDVPRNKIDNKFE